MIKYAWLKILRLSIRWNLSVGFATFIDKQLPNYYQLRITFGPCKVALKPRTLKTIQTLYIVGCRGVTQLKGLLPDL